MKNINKNIAVIVVALIVIVGGATALNAASTIGNDVSVGGTLTVGSVASTTDYFVVGNSLGNDDDAIYFDIGLAESLMWDDSLTQFDFSDSLQINGDATTTGDLVISGGDLNKDATALTIGGAVTFTTSGTFTTFASSTTALNTQGTMHVGGAAVIEGTLAVTGNATTTGDLVIVGGDLNKDATALTIGGATTFTTSGTFTTFASSTTALNTQGTMHVGGATVIEGNATSSSHFVVGSEVANATTTLSIKTDGKPGSCIEMWDVGTTPAIHRIYLSGTTMVIEAGTCK